MIPKQAEENKQGMMKNTFTFKIFFKVCTVALLLSGFADAGFAADYYWRINAADEQFNNLANWETAPGNGVSPATAPGPNDDVYFLQASTHSNLTSAKISSFRNLYFSSNSDYYFQNMECQVFGSVHANGNLYLDNARMDFYADTLYTFTMGTDSCRITNSSITFNKSAGAILKISNNDVRIKNGDMVMHNGVVKVNNANLYARNIISSDSAKLMFSNIHLIAEQGISLKSYDTINLNQSRLEVIPISPKSYISLKSASSLTLQGATISCQGKVSIEQGTNVTASNSLKVIAKEFACAASMDFRTLSAEYVHCKGATVSVDTLLFFSSSEVMRITSSQLSVDDALLLPPSAATIMLKGSLELDSVIHAGGCNNSWLLSGDSAIAQVKLNTNFTTTNLFFDKVEFSNLNLISLPDHLNLGGNSGNVSWQPASVPKTFYWIAGSGNWFDAQCWSMNSGGPPLPASACPPSKKDTVVFDSHSFSAQGQTVVVDKTVAACAHILWTDSLAYGSMQGNKLFVFGSADLSGCNNVNTNLFLKGTSSNTLKAASTIFYKDVVLDCKPGSYDLNSNIESTKSLLIKSGELISNSYSLKFFNLSTDSDNNMPGLDFQGSHIQLQGDWTIADKLQYATLTGTTIECTDFISSAQTQQLHYEQLRVSGNRIITENVTPKGVFIDELICEENTRWVSSSSATVNQVFVAPFSTLELFHGDTLFVEGNIQLNGSGNVCATETFSITSHSAPQRVKLMKTGNGQFLSQNVYAEYLHVIGKSLKLVNGVNLGNNTNVILVSLFNPLPRNFYWVNGSGNWTDGITHWSVGVPGGNSAATNPDGCVPTKFDNVYFDASSFSANGQSVTVDTSRIDFSNMYWSSARKPVFTGDTAVQMNCFGSVMFEPGMVHDFHGTLFMRGSHQMAYSHALITNNVALKSPVCLSGGGRYDLLNNLVLNTGAEGLKLDNGHFYTNGYDISFLSTTKEPGQYDVFLKLTSDNSADISGSVIGSKLKGVSYNAEHKSSVNFNAAGSRIYMSGERNIISGTVNIPVQYESFVFPEAGNHGLANELNSRVNLSKLQWLTGNARINGDFQTDTLEFAKSSNNMLGAGDTLVVTDTLIAAATPCNLISFNSSQSGIHACLSLPECNTQLDFAAFKDIKALPLASCSTALTVGGLDVGNNQNIAFHPLDTSAYKLLGSDTAVSCATVPYLITANITGQSVAFSWSSGDTTQSIPVFNPGDYSLKASYDSSCFLLDTVNVEIIDTVPPSVVCASDTVVSTDPGSCTFLIDSKYFDPLVYDDCGVNKIWYVLLGATNGSDTVSTLKNITLNSGLTTISWFVSDYAAPNPNISSCSFTIEVRDSIKPTASNPPAVTVSCPGDIPAPDPAVVTDEADNCGIVSVYYVSESSDGNHCPETITRTYQVIDAAGNSIVVYHSIVVDDQIAPVASTPQAVMVQCPDDVPAPDTSIIQNVSDNCGPVNISLYAESSDGNTCPETITRTYMLSDDCGNTSFVDHQIVVNDTIPPMVSALPTLNVSCKSNIPSPDTSSLLHSDNCGVASVSFLADISDGNSCPETISRRYQVKDSCGNSTVIIQQIIVHDTVAPSAIAPPDVQLQCKSLMLPADTSVLQGVTDNCGNVSVSFLADSSNGNACPEIIERYYRLSDDCGNTSLVKQRFVIEDTVAPVIAAIPAIHIQCQSAIPAPDPALVSASDNCGAVSISFISDSTDGGACQETIFRKYMVEDDCGNRSYTYQSIVIQDTIAPTVQQPDTLFLSCKSALGAPDSSVIIAVDNCSAVQYVYMGQTSDGNSCPERINRQWRVLDECGNASVATRTIIINDTIKPSAASLPVISVQCKSDMPPVHAVNFSAFDNCGVKDVSFLSESTDGNKCPETITREYQLTDSCGNSSVVQQAIVIHDLIPPMAGFIQDTVVDCVNAVPLPDASVVKGASDNCGIDTIMFLQDILPSWNCPDTLFRVYQIVDSCGNSATALQRIIVSDTIAPQLIAVPDLHTQCLATIPAPDTSLILATDNCSIHTINHLKDSVNMNACTGEVLRSFVVSDACGNTSIAVQKIFIEDTIPPSGTLNSPVHISCANNIPLPNPKAVTATDNCGVAAISFLSDSTDGKTCPETIYRSYLITDSCGNTTKIGQQIIVQDTIAPTILNMPSDTGFSTEPGKCGSVVSWISPLANDNCQLDTMVSSHNNGSYLQAGYTYVSFQAWDQCGNMHADSFLIHIQDNEAPVIQCSADTMLENTPGECGANFYFDFPSAADNCQLDTMYCSHKTGSWFPVGDTTVTFYAADASGNIDSCNVKVKVVDTEAPTIDCPASFSSCDTVVEFMIPSSLDNCTKSYAFQTAGLPSNTVYPVGVTSNTFYATDMHGNMDSCTFTVEVFPAPSLSWTITDISSYGASDGEIEITVHGGTPSFVYQWNTGADSNKVTGLSPGDYVVMVTDSNGCSVLDSIKMVQPQTIAEIELPEGISPNGDGMNDVFIIRNIEQVPQNELLVFDRRGEKVYSKKNYKNTWRGENENGEPLAEGIYFVVFKVPDERITLKGYLYIRR